jgi:hypothetical protein
MALHPHIDVNCTSSTWAFSTPKSIRPIIESEAPALHLAEERKTDGAAVRNIRENRAKMSDNQ